VPSSRIALTWPTRDTVPRQHASGAWSSEASDKRERTAIALRLGESFGPHPTTSLVLVGDRIDALQTLSRTLKSRCKLIYADVPRLEGFDESRAFRAEDGRTWGTWLAVVRSHLAAAKGLLARDGIVVVQAGDLEEPYAKVLLYELFKPQNYLGTIVWQSHYSPKGGKPGKEIAAVHESLICFARERDAVSRVALPQVATGYANPDSDPREDWKAPQKDAGRDTVKLKYNLPPYRWECDGELPPGIWRVSPFSGVIWGIPTVAGKWNFAVEVFDRQSRSSRTEFTLTVVDEGDPPMPPERIWWMDGSPKPTSEPPLIGTVALPEGIVGHTYSVVLEASGGDPTVGEKRPSRGWGFGERTLIEAIREDRCDFGVKGTAIPEPKRYLKDLKEGKSYSNVMSWWPGADVGWSQDATKHLRALQAAGLIEEMVETAKPEKLILRLLEAFSAPEDTVVELFARSGDLAAVALKTGRPFVALGGASDLDHRAIEGCCVPRLRAIVDRREPVALDEAQVVGVPDAAVVRGFTYGHTSNAVATQQPETDEFPRLVRDQYPGDGSLSRAILTSQGYLLEADDTGMATGVAPGDGGRAVALDPQVFLDGTLAAELVSAAEARPLVVYYFRASEDFDPRAFESVATFKRVPMDLSC
jgi:DNA methylase